jgi:NTP pyrophosphatase (non-canonical NTP hydrolase)
VVWFKSKESNPMNEIQELTRQILEFRDEREWKQFHNSKDMAISLVLEASELLEHFQWKSTEEVLDHLENHRNSVGEELADILYWVLLLSNDLHIDIKAAFQEKMKKNAKKYPIEKAKGSHKKYSDL